MRTKQCTKCHSVRSVSEFGKNSKYKDGLQNQCCFCIRDKKFKNLQKKNPNHKRYFDWAEDKKIIYKRVLNKVSNLPEGFGYWLAGLTDGEGSFNASPYKVKNYEYIRFTFSIRLRIDDLPALQYIVSVLNTGAIGFTYSKKPNHNPIAYLIFQNKEDLYYIYLIFSKYSLKCKKQIDFKIWSLGILYLLQYRSNMSQNYLINISNMLKSIRIFPVEEKFNIYQALLADQIHRTESKHLVYRG